MAAMSSRPLCQCGCGREVAPGRKFVSQTHYNVWLSRARYVGRNWKLS